MINATVRTITGWFSAQRSKVCSNNHFSPLTNRPSLCSWPPFGLSKKEQSTGITVSETTNEAIIEMMVAMAMGAKSFPSTPVSPNSGKKTRMMSTVA